MTGRGAAPEMEWRAALRRAVHRRMNGEGTQKRLERLAEVVVEQALGGDMAATREIGDRLDGKAVARQVIEGDGSLLAGFAAILAAVNEERRRRVEGGRLEAQIVDVTPDYVAAQQNEAVGQIDPERLESAKKPVE